jgi:two-component system phosphate regulon response regulator OmpR
MYPHPHILVVSNQLASQDMLVAYLSKHGFTVYMASAASVREAMTAHTLHLVLLDMRMPGEDGLSLVRFLREQYPLGIITLTAVDDVIERILGLEMGADDCLTLPCDPRELVARVKSVLRRVECPSAAVATAAHTEHNCVRIGSCVLNLATHTLHTLEGRMIPITSMEFDLLQAFATHPNRVLSRDQLLDMAHHREGEPFDRSIDIRVARLRRKIEIVPTKPQVIKTIRGGGYMFVPSLGPLAQHSYRAMS